MKKWTLGIYRRRSFDEKGEEESNSVVNQKKLIDDYLVDKNDIIIYKDYVDDGYTGTDFNRPAYKRMLNDIKKEKNKWYYSKGFIKIRKKLYRGRKFY